ncbi:CPBP family intramembrane glutamic endopeptidase [Brevibacillus dissolubilis]|uniref:CPBP family intramembrane glutamic endopeptidase n=1 Tax=Brevibacillus dissolubilis TaxID=1844116 RepID=UPI0011166214|nr:type II CAAX endopeptidase family protein [Brevibacillus dissolubilis]
MQLQTGYYPQLYTERPPRSRKWAILLFIGYWLNLVFELSMLRIAPGVDGRWVVSTVEEPPEWTIFLLMGSGMFSLACASMFVITFLRDRRNRALRRDGARVTGEDFIYTLAWLHLFNTIMLWAYGMFLPFPFFPEGSIGGMLESASMQVTILGIALFGYFGRAGVIGFRRPAHPGKMILTLLAIFLFIAVALDSLLTSPIADFFNMSLDSEREEAISQELFSAKEQNLLNTVFSVAVIGMMVPIAEEILFRGVIQSYLVQRWGAVLGILASSFWFALIHIDLALFVPLFVIGLGLGFMRHQFQSLWAPILLHSMNNLFSVLLSLYSS